MVCLLTWLAVSVQAQDRAKIRQQERDVKAAIVFKLLRFVEWPETSVLQDEPLTLCVWPNEPYLETFREIQGSKVGSHSLEVALVNPQNSEFCHVLFGSREMAASTEQWRSVSDGKSILTISDSNDFAGKSGMIHLMMRDQRVSFAVNISALENAGLRMSALVLNLAEIQSANTSLPQIQTPVERTNEHP